ncbi:hypothetical protein K432DRAFT_201973 [Lepidopterella palustris CBS 459.81]|uniref:Uncharacterized protein n=1 Tax=Lepidopterella palustris CBS 459.81 TaxID=1314670 RepID=A0A8E2EL76_9PEZI|nr:hypothetical protein K432DRAFT_201973 [Lepidopterella palustris CBS 459.81]
MEPDRAPHQLRKPCLQVAFLLSGSNHIFSHPNSRRTNAMCAALFLKPAILRMCDVRQISGPAGSNSNKRERKEWHRTFASAPAFVFLSFFSLARGL